MSQSRRAPAVVAPLGGFVDSLVQKFENCRSGLTDELLSAGDAERFFTGLTESELPALRDAIRLEEGHLPEDTRDTLFHRVNDLLRAVVIPSYVRFAVRFTKRERNDFFLVRDPFHALERIGFALLGVGLGAWVVWAPFIPLWSKEWIAPFAILGLVFPNLRRLWEVRRYEQELNHLIARTNREIGRTDLGYLLHSEETARPSSPLEAARIGQRDDAHQPRKAR